MNIHLPAILMFTRGTRFWPIPISLPHYIILILFHCIPLIFHSYYPMLIVNRYFITIHYIPLSFHDIPLIFHEHPRWWTCWYHINIPSKSHSYPTNIPQIYWVMSISMIFPYCHSVLSRTTSSAACSAALQAQPKGPAAAMAAATANDRKEEGEKSSAPRGVVGKKRWYHLDLMGFNGIYGGLMGSNNGIYPLVN